MQKRSDTRLEEDLQMPEKNQRLHRVFNKIVTDLEQFEEKYGMGSEEFYAAFQSGELESEDEELFKWRALYAAYRNMERRYSMSR
jgi:hypothetical protein